jgi:hypothetical protein
MHRKNRNLGAIACVGCCCAGAAAQTHVDLRIVPRIGYTHTLSGYEAVYDLAVQARVTSPGNASGLAAFAFDIRVLNEPESAGRLWQDSITLDDRTYDPEIRTLNLVGKGGLASQYSYLASLSPSFNGVINISRGSFTNGPDQEMGLITGTLAGMFLLSTPGVDEDYDGSPDSTPLDAGIMSTYFAAGEFTDIYRFRYAAQSNTGRAFNFQLVNVTGIQVFSGLQSVNGYWGLDGVAAVSGADLAVQGLEVRALPAPGIALWLGGAGLALGCRRKR